MNAYTVIKKPLLTEKSAANKERLNEYWFAVDGRANKIEIKQAIEHIFKVTVIDVNTVTMPGKSRRFGMHRTEAKTWKKAVARLKQGDRIQLQEGV
jgi:large subunit ribosomal protein L23